jgi:hypothetical protein
MKAGLVVDGVLHGIRYLPGENNTGGEMDLEMQPSLNSTSILLTV